MGRCTNIRAREVQSCPVLSKIAHIDFSTQRSRSASANTTFADLPPSSSEIRVMWSAACFMICAPTAVDPVNPTLLTRGSVTSAVPTVEPGPGNTLIVRSEEHTSELQSQSNLVCRLLLEKKKK